MKARPAEAADTSEVVRLARVMFESMGMDLYDQEWEDAGRRHVRERLGKDLAIFVVDHPNRDGRLAAAAAGTVAQRLPTPVNPEGLPGTCSGCAPSPSFVVKV